MTDLRIGVVRFDDRLYAWQASVLERLGRLQGVVIAAYIGCPHTPETGYRYPPRSWAFEVVADAPGGPDSFATDFADWKRFDLIINLTRAAIRPAELYGLWQLHSADPDQPGRSEVRYGDPVSHLYLRQDLPEGGRTLGHICYRTAANHRRNCDRLMMGAAMLFERSLRAILAGLPPPPLSPLPPHPSHPTWRRRVSRRLHRTGEKTFFRTRWTVGLIPHGVDEILRRRELPVVRWLRGLPPDRFFADPFPINVTTDAISALVENGAMVPPHKGHISALTIRRNGDVACIKDALIKEEHLSFPYFFREGEQLICLPECHQAGMLRAFRWVGDAWLPDAVLLDGVAAVDPVLLQHADKWWLFCCDRAHEDTARLFLYFSDSWRGPWKPHPLNPVKSDVRSSRPAGSIIKIDGELYRPAQDCSERYGGAVNMQRITELSEIAFSEEAAFLLEPRLLGKRFIGLHTINGLGDVSMIDGLERRFIFHRWTR